jgi:hypothetical protein
LDPFEKDAYPRLQKAVKKAGGALNVAVTGPLKKVRNGCLLEVRQFSVFQAKPGV